MIDPAVEQRREDYEAKRLARIKADVEAGWLRGVEDGDVAFLYRQLQKQADSLRAVLVQEVEKLLTETEKELLSCQATTEDCACENNAGRHSAFQTVIKLLAERRPTPGSAEER